MKELFHQYLCDRDHPVPARTLVEQVMGLTGAGDGLCNRIVEGLLQEDERFERDRLGRWQVRSPEIFARSLEDVPVIVAHGRSARSVSGFPQVVQLGTLAVLGGKVRSCNTTLVRPALPVLADSLAVLGLTPGKLRRAPSLEKAVCNVLDLGTKHMWVVWNSRWFERLLHAAGVSGFHGPVLPVRACAKGLFSDRSPRHLSGLASLFAFAFPDQPLMEDELHLLAESFAQLKEALQRIDVCTVAAAMAFCAQQTLQVDFSLYGFDERFVSCLPERPGVYLMRDSSGEVLYVGKAKSLRSRVGSYFSGLTGEEEKKRRILQAVYHIDIEETATEPEALIREAELIALHAPPMNTQLAVHERKTPYAKARNLVVLVPGGEGCVNLLYAGRGRLLQRETLRADDLDIDGIAACLERFFSLEARPSPGAGRLQRELFSSWIESNREHLICVDIESCESTAHAAKLIAEHARDILEGNPRAFRV